jgi:hypothetical protein
MEALHFCSATISICSNPLMVSTPARRVQGSLRPCWRKRGRRFPTSGRRSRPLCGLQRNRDSFYAIRRFGQLIGGVSYLFLTDDGLDRLILDELDFCDPDPEILTPPDREPAAIYIWACAAKGRAALGLGSPCWRLRQWPYGRADYYAQPNTEEGVRFVQQLGFERTPSFQRDLWIFRRRCNRLRDQSSVSQGVPVRQAA